MRYNQFSALNMASSSNSTLTNSAARKMKVAELRQELLSRGLDSGGLKQDLLDRLLNDLSSASNAAAAAPQTTETKTKRKDSDGEGSSLDISPSTRYVLRFHGTFNHISATASCGCVLYNSETDKTVWCGTQFYSAGESAQLAEMKCLSQALSGLYKLGVRRLIVQGHARGTVVNQLQGNFGVRTKPLQALYTDIERIMAQFEECEVWGIAVDQIAKVQVLSKQSLDSKTSEGFEVFSVFSKHVPVADQDGGDIASSDVHGNDVDRHDHSIEDKAINHSDDLHTEDLGLEAQDHDDDEEEEEETLVPLPSFSPTKQYVLRFDGGSRGNPGTSGAGMVIFDSESGLEVWSAFEYLEETTNNVAEYSALLSGLKCAKALGINKIIAEGDSTLVVKQVKGEYEVKSAHLKPLCTSVREVARSFSSFSINYIPRAENFRADQLANVAMDEKFSMGLEVLDYLESDEHVSGQPKGRTNRSRPEVVDAVASAPMMAQPSAYSSPGDSSAISHDQLPIPDAEISEHQLSPHRTYVLRFGGGTKDQSGGGSAAVLKDDISGEEIWSGFHFVDDRDASQFIAGYTGLILGLRKASSMGVQRLIVEGNMKFVIEQMAGNWKVKSEEIKPYYAHAKELSDNFEDVEYQLISSQDIAHLKALCGDAIAYRQSQLPGFSSYK